MSPPTSTSKRLSPASDALKIEWLEHGSSDKLDYPAIYRCTAMDRIELVHKRVPANWVKWIVVDLNLPTSATYAALNVSITTMNRKIKKNERLSQDESERVIGLAKLIGQVQTMVEESGTPENFDAQAWTARWLSEPLPALGGVKPIQLLDTMEGQSLVSDAVETMRSGAYA